MATIMSFREALDGLVAKSDGTFTPFEACTGSSKADVRNYRFCSLTKEEDDRYETIVESSFTEVNIFSERFLADENSRRYGVYHVTDGLVGTCAFRDASDNDLLVRHLTRHLSSPPRVIWEVNNVAVTADHRGGPVSAFLLFGCALTAHRQNVDALAGVIRSMAIPSLTHFGLVPTYHEPLHVLGRPDVCDFISYYDTQEPESVMYMRERAARYFYAEHVIHQIRTHARMAKQAGVSS